MAHFEKYGVRSENIGGQKRYLLTVYKPATDSRSVFWKPSRVVDSDYDGKALIARNRDKYTLDTDLAFRQLTPEELKIHESSMGDIPAHQENASGLSRLQDWIDAVHTDPFKKDMFADWLDDQRSPLATVVRNALPISSPHTNYPYFRVAHPGTENPDDYTVIHPLKEEAMPSQRHARVALNPSIHHNVPDNLNLGTWYDLDDRTPAWKHRAQILTPAFHRRGGLASKGPELLSPAVIWTHYAPGPRKGKHQWTTFHAPLSHEEFHDFANALPEEHKTAWLAWHKQHFGDKPAHAEHLARRVTDPQAGEHDWRIHDYLNVRHQSPDNLSLDHLASWLEIHGDMRHHIVRAALRHKNRPVVHASPFGAIFGNTADGDLISSQSVGSHTGHASSLDLVAHSNVQPSLLRNLPWPPEAVNGVDPPERWTPQTSIVGPGVLVHSHEYMAPSLTASMGIPFRTTSGPITGYPMVEHKVVAPILRWAKRSSDNTYWHAFHAPVTHQKLHEFIDSLPEAIGSEWRRWAHKMGFKKPTNHESPKRLERFKNTIDKGIERWRDFKPTKTHPAPYHHVSMDEMNQKEWLFGQGAGSQEFADASAVLAGSKPMALVHQPWLDSHPVGKEVKQRLIDMGLSVVKHPHYKENYVVGPQAHIDAYTTDFKNIKSQEEMWRVNGKHLGYPQDAVDEFVERVSADRKKLARKDPSLTHPFNSTELALVHQLHTPGGTEHAFHIMLDATGDSGHPLHGLLAHWFQHKEDTTHPWDVHQNYVRQNGNYEAWERGGIHQPLDHTSGLSTPLPGQHWKTSTHSEKSPSFIVQMQPRLDSPRHAVVFSSTEETVGPPSYAGLRFVVSDRAAAEYAKKIGGEYLANFKQLLLSAHKQRKSRGPVHRLAKYEDHMTSDVTALHTAVQKDPEKLTFLRDAMHDAGHPWAPLLDHYLDHHDSHIPQKSYPHNSRSIYTTKHEYSTDTGTQRNHWATDPVDVDSPSALFMAPSRVPYSNQHHVIMSIGDPNSDDPNHSIEFAVPNELAHAVAENIGGDFLAHHQKLNRLRNAHLKVQLARTKAPAGGAIVNNQYVPGGKFMPKALQRIRDVLSRHRQKTAVPLARPKLPGSSVPILKTAGFDLHNQPHETLSIDQLRKVEDTYKVPDEHRLSHKATFTSPDLFSQGSIKAKGEDVRNFFDAIADKRLTDHELRTQLLDTTNTGKEKLTYLVNHLAQEARHFSEGLRAGGGANEWYGANVDAFESGLHKLYGHHDPRVWGTVDPKTNRVRRTKGSLADSAPAMVLAKAVLAFSSGGQNPVVNSQIMSRMLDAGVKRAGKTDPNIFAHIPEFNIDASEEYLNKLRLVYPNEPEVTTVGSTPQEWYEWYKRYQKPIERKVQPGYRRAQVGVKNGQVIYRKQAGRINMLPEFANVDPRGAQEVYVPKPDANGKLQPMAWSNRPSIVTGLRDLKLLVETMTQRAKGNPVVGMRLAANWLLTDHDSHEFEQMFPGKKINRGYLPANSPVPGAFIFGPKFGPFLLNLHGNEENGIEKYGRFLTPDMWWSRTWNRYTATLSRMVSGAQEAVEAPRSPAERRIMFQAAKEAAKAAGLRSVAELQAVLWYYEQNLWRIFGAKNQSLSFLDGINELLRQKGHSPIALGTPGKGRGKTGKGK